VKQRTPGLMTKKYSTLLSSVPNTYGRRFMAVLPGDWESNPGSLEESNFKQKLWEQGLKRLGRMVELWSDECYQNTFLSLFMSGAGHSRSAEFEDCLPKGMLEGLEKAVAKLPPDYKRAFKKNTSKAVSKSPSLEQALVILVEDFTKYLSLVRFWPCFVQSVRFLENKYARHPGKELEWMIPIP
jgi:hypothetical protein